MTLETATPTFGLFVPTLRPWNLSIHKPPVPTAPAMRRSLIGGGGRPRISRKETARKVEESEESDDDMGFGLFDDGPAPVMAAPAVAVTSKGNVSATFQVPGLISIPSDNGAHNVTIVELKLNATMSWLAVPKESSQVHLRVCLSAYQAPPF